MLTCSCCDERLTRNTVCQCVPEYCSKCLLCESHCQCEQPQILSDDDYCDEAVIRD